MAVPTPEAFVYCWSDKQTQMLYIGVHKGTPDDGYVCSSKVVLQEYKKRPFDFSRSIIATGSVSEMRLLESTMLQQVDAAKNNMYYNQHNNDGSFFCDSHSEQTKKKMSNTWKKRGVFNCDHLKAVASWIGKSHSEDSKALMREAAKAHSANRSQSFTNNNPMKNPASIQKMLDTRRINKEMRNGRSN